MTEAAGVAIFASQGKDRYVLVAQYGIPVATGLAKGRPIGLPLAWKATVEAVTTVAGLVVLLGGFVSAVALILRFRRSRGDERQQIKWLAYVGAAALIIPLTGLAIGLVRVIIGIHAPENDPIGNALTIAFFVILMVGIPAACTIAAFKYRLYDLDIVVKKTVMFGLIALALTAIGLATIALLPTFALGISSGISLRSVLLGLALGLLVWPFRRFASRIADRVVRHASHPLRGVVRVLRSHGQYVLHRGRSAPDGGDPRAGLRRRSSRGLAPGGDRDPTGRLVAG